MTNDKNHLQEQDLLKQIEEQNEKIKQMELKRKQMEEQYKELLEKEAGITKKTVCEAIQYLLNQSSQSFRLLSMKMNLDDKTIKSFSIADDFEKFSNRTISIIGDYFTRQFKKLFQSIAKYKAYISANNSEDRKLIYDKLLVQFELFLEGINKFCKNEMIIEEKNTVTTDKYYWINVNNEDIDLSFTKINGEVIINGKVYNGLHDWTDLGPLLCEILANKNPRLFSDLVNSYNFRYFLGNTQVNKRRIKIKGTNYFFNRKNSPKNIQGEIKDIMKYRYSHGGNEITVGVSIIQN